MTTAAGFSTLKLVRVRIGNSISIMLYSAGNGSVISLAPLK